MNFEDAMNKTFDEMVKKNPQIANQGLFTPEGFDAAVVIWNMVAIALKEKGLDDIVLVGNNNSIISIPISGEKKPKEPKPPKEPKETKKNKGKEKVKDEKTSSKQPVNGKEEKQTENTDQSAPETTDKE